MSIKTIHVVAGGELTRIKITASDGTHLFNSDQVVGDVEKVKAEVLSDFKGGEFDFIEQNPLAALAADSDEDVAAWNKEFPDAALVYEAQ